jgi:hypothetical protein
MKARNSKTRWHALPLVAMTVAVLVMVVAVGATQYLVSPSATATGYGPTVYNGEAIAAEENAQNAPLLDTFDRATAFLQSYHANQADGLTDLSDRHSPDELRRMMGWTSR